MTETRAPLGTCPMPILQHDHVLLGHGSGGILSAQLVEKIYLPAFSNPALDQLDDQAVLEMGPGRLAFTTDSFVVTPLFFPGGDIGRLAVNGTVNDLAMSGARPRYLSAAFIIEEGFPIADLRRVVLSMRKAAHEASVQIVTGDTKVVGRGKGDQIFVNTSGVGVVPEGIHLSASRAAPGDVILLSGSLADHGMAIMTLRESLGIESTIESDTAPLHELVAAMLTEFPGIHALRDPTRGGLATSLQEIAARADVGVEIEEGAILVRDEVRGACEILGFDPLYVANEGKLVAFVPPQGADAVLAAMRAHPLGRDAARIGVVTDTHKGMAVLRTRIGATRVLERPYGELLPRIC